MAYITNVLLIYAFLFAAAVPSPSFGEPGGHQHTSPASSAHPGGSPPLIEEMTLLDSVYKDIVSQSLSETTAGCKKRSNPCTVPWKRPMKGSTQGP